MTDNNVPASDEHSMVIERMVDAPVETVWQMWTEAEHFQAWYGPTGAAIPVANMDVKVGGSRLICMEMETPNGPMQMWFAGEFREIVPNTRLVYTDAMADADGNLKSAAEMGMPEDSVMTTEVIVELEAVGDQTRMVLTHVGIPADSPGAAGWGMAVDKLVERIAALSS